MNFDLLANLSKLGGMSLTTEEKTLLGMEMEALKLEGLSSVQFWGKINGDSTDYLIVYALVPEGAYPVKKFFVASNTAIKLLPLEPAVAREVESHFRFSGDLSAEILPEVEAVEETEETKAQECLPAYSEAAHLYTVVAEIDAATSVVPRGAFVVDPTHQVVPSMSFSGLFNQDALSLDSYFLFRKPSSPDSKLDGNGIVKPVDFLDSIESTHPRGAWAISAGPGRSTAQIKSLLYPGYSFYHTIGTKEFGGAYFGDGVKNHDIAFML